MRLRCFSLALAMLASPAVAHDFWLQPARFQVAVNAPVSATFLVGHAALRERWNNNDRIVALKAFFKGRNWDLRRDLRSGDVDLVTRFGAPGLHVLGMQSNHAFSDLPAGRFNDYARDEGLALISASRQRSGTLQNPGRERYSRRAKALIQVGAGHSTDLSTASRAVGLKLEIVPDRNPYALDRSRILPVHVLYNGRRLANATVRLTDLGDDAKPVATVITDQAGRARFRVPNRGNWLLNVVWGEPVTGNPRYEFDTVFSSLTFGYDR